MNGFSFHLKKKSQLHALILLFLPVKKKENQCDANDAVKINWDVG